MYDIIGDIHGHVKLLKELLLVMGYSNESGYWSHPTRKAIFVGDFIDRGPNIREVLHIVKGMIDHDQAFAVMGNHEYNAIAYSFQLPDGNYLRSHNATHTHQHQATLDQFKDFPDEWSNWLKWFYTLPLFLDFGDFRVVHACWDQDNIDWLKQYYKATLTESLLINAHKKGSFAYLVIEETLKGKEMSIPEHLAWKDKDGHPRASNRIKWWVDPTNTNHDTFLFNCPESLKKESVSADLPFNHYPVYAPPVFFGHYWLNDSWPIVQSNNAVCLDYSVAKGGNLVAYRWNGEQKLKSDAFLVISSL